MHGEATPGVLITRRTALRGSLALATALGLDVAARAAPQDAQDPPFATFTRQWTELLRELLEEKTPDEDRYLYRLCALMRGVPAPAFPRMTQPGFDRDGLQTGGAWGKGALMIVEVKLQPDAVIPAHNHVGFDFVSLGLEGSCVTRHYEPLSDVAPASSGRSAVFQVQETRSAALRPGRSSHLSRVRDNVHWFQAGDEGATLLDFGTKYEDPGDGYREFSALEIDDEPVDARRRIFEACWTGNPYK